MKGFKNIGNTCYLNAGLQMLIQNKDLCRLIIHNSENSEILNKIKNLIINYHNLSDNNGNVINPSEIKSIVKKSQNIFNGYNQQDSSEFIVCLLNIIDEEIKKENIQSKGIEELFGIHFNVRIKCKYTECLKENIIKEQNNFLLLDINSECNDLDDLYRLSKSSEKLENDNKYFCENCQVKRVASKRSMIEEWPKHLFIWLKRFIQNGNILTKNNTIINIPLEWRHGYQLYGAVLHYGNLNGGHYVYIGKNHNKWYLYDDSSIAEINNDSDLVSLLNNAYWLYYKKKI